MLLNKKIIIFLNYNFIDKIKVKLIYKIKKKKKISLPPISNYFIKNKLIIKEKSKNITPKIKYKLIKKELFFIQKNIKTPKISILLKKKINNIFNKKYKLYKKPIGLIYNNNIKEAEKIIIEFDILKYIIRKDNKLINKTKIKNINKDIYLNIYNYNNIDTTRLVIKYDLKIIYEESDIFIKSSYKNIYKNDIKECLESEILKIIYN